MWNEIWKKDIHRSLALKVFKNGEISILLKKVSLILKCLKLEI